MSSSAAWRRPLPWRSPDERAWGTGAARAAGKAPAPSEVQKARRVGPALPQGHAGAPLGRGWHGGPMQACAWDEQNSFSASEVFVYGAPHAVLECLGKRAQEASTTLAAAGTLALQRSGEEADLQRCDGALDTP
mmetsp:Transcript_107458/g.342446  ORF Transcript_107458/g.342446 Transcript_107458/m.342446 type:complete len:134 (+) Transcript_107458:2-403(+)